MALSTFSGKTRKCLRRSSQKTMDLLWVFFVSSHGEAQRCGKIVVADALVSCVGMMVRKQTEQIEVQRKSGDARERSSIPRFNPHPTEARTRSPESVTLCPRSVCLQGGKSKKKRMPFSSPRRDHQSERKPPHMVTHSEESDASTSHHSQQMRRLVAPSLWLLL